MKAYLKSLYKMEQENDLYFNEYWYKGKTIEWYKPVILSQFPLQTPAVISIPSISIYTQSSLVLSN